MKEKIVLLEKAKTPYRPPLFEYIGTKTDLTVIYAGVAQGNREWNVEHKPQNYNEIFLSSVNLGPVAITKGLSDVLKSLKYNHLVIASQLHHLVNSLISLYMTNLNDTYITVWTENIITPWLRGVGRPLYLRGIKIITEVPVKYSQCYLYSISDNIVAYSNLAAERTLNVGASRNKITAAPQWYPSCKLVDVTKQTGTDAFRILFIGELSKRKGVDILLDVATKYPNPGEMEFVFAGDGNLKEAVKNASSNYKHIKALGYISETRKSIEYKTADLIVLPSRHDPWGLVINESYIFSKPAITTNCAGAEMIVPDELTVNAGNTEDLWEAIQYVRNTELQPMSQPCIEEMGDPLIRDS